MKYFRYVTVRENEVDDINKQPFTNIGEILDREFDLSHYMVYALSLSLYNKLNQKKVTAGKYKVCLVNRR